MRISDWSSDVCSSDLSLASEASQLLKLVSRFNISRTENAKRRPVATPRPMVAVPKAMRKPAVKALPVSHGNTALKARSAERRVGKSVSVRVDLGGRRIIKKTRYTHSPNQKKQL